MKKTYRLSILLLTLFLTNFIYGQSKVFDNLTMNSEILNMERNYAIYLPPDYETSSRSYPVLYLLHGLGDDQTGWIQFGEVKKIADNSIINGNATPMIISGTTLAMDPPIPVVCKAFEFVRSDIFLGGNHKGREYTDATSEPAIDFNTTIFDHQKLIDLSFQ